MGIWTLLLLRRNVRVHAVMASRPSPMWGAGAGTHSRTSAGGTRTTAHSHACAISTLFSDFENEILPKFIFVLHRVCMASSGDMKIHAYCSTLALQREGDTCGLMPGSPTPLTSGEEANHAGCGDTAPFLPWAGSTPPHLPPALPPDVGCGGGLRGPGPHGPWGAAASLLGPARNTVQ